MSRPHPEIHRKPFEKLRIRLSQFFTVALLLLSIFTRSRWEEAESGVATLLFFVGLTLAASGALGRLWCSAYIAGNKSTQLITEGPYSLSRNPLYFFSLIGGIGIGLSTETVTFAVAIAAAFLLYYPPVIRREQAKLETLYGETYRDYQRAVPAFWPRWTGLREPEQQTINPRIFRRHAAAAIWFVWIVGLLEVAESLRELGVLPTLLRLF